MKKVGDAVTVLGEELPAQADESFGKSKDAGKEIIKKIERSILVIHVFTLAFITQKLMKIFNKAKTNGPDGKANDVTK